MVGSVIVVESLDVEEIHQLGKRNLIPSLLSCARTNWRGSSLLWIGWRGGPFPLAWEFPALDRLEKGSTPPPQDPVDRGSNFQIYHKSYTK